MAKLVTKGFLSGHLPTKGWFSTIAQHKEKLISIFENAVGLTPILRAKFDLDGDGIYEHIEEPMSAGNINKNIQFAFGIMNPGSCSLKLDNTDNRWSDNSINSLVYEIRYFKRRVLIELNVDWIHKDNEAYWQPIFLGYIVSKNEDAEERTVNINLQDVFPSTLDFELAPIVNASTVVPYNPVVVDNRQVQMGLYYGDFQIYIDEYYIRDPKLLIRTVYNTAPADYHRLVDNVLESAPANHLLIPAMINLSIVKDSFARVGTSRTKKVWIWLWNDLDIGEGGWTWEIGIEPRKQWGYIDTTTFATWTSDGYCGLNFATDIPVYNGEDVLLLTLSESDYFTRPSYGTQARELFDPEFRLAINIDTKAYNEIDIDTHYWDNIYKALYHTLVDIVGITATDFDKYTGTGIFFWKDELKFPGDSNYFSWDASAYLMKISSIKIGVNINKSTKLKNWIDDICMLTNSSYFNGWGVKSGANIIRQIKIVYTTMYIAGYTYNSILNDKVMEIAISKDFSNIFNRIKAGEWLMDNTLDIEQNTFLYDISDSTSVGVYGEKIMDLAWYPGEKNIFYYGNSGSVATAVATGLRLRFKEPKQTVIFKVDLKGLLYELKHLVGINEQLSLALNPTDTIKSGMFELTDVQFNTSNFLFTFKGTAAKVLLP